MSNTLVNILKIKELRSRIFFTLGILIITRIGAQIPVPGIDYRALQLFLQSGAANSGNQFFDYLNFFAGGAFSNLSIFSLGIMPYITTSIIFQLLMLVFPAIKRLAEEEGGRRKITQFQRIGTIPVGLLNSFIVIQFVNQLKASGTNVVVLDNMIFFYIMTMIVTTTGTIILMWLGERITDKGIGNGISLLIFAGIVARMPEAVMQLFNGVKGKSIDIPILLFILIMFIFMIALVIYEQQGQRKVPVNYAKRIVGRKVYGAPNTYLPLKLNPSGVMPIIFANSVIMLPQVIGNLFGNAPWVQWLGTAMRNDGLPYMVVYSILIIFFAYFYTQVSLNPIEIAKNIRENGGSIPGVPVNKVEEYLSRVLNRIVLPGAIFLAFIAIVPTIVINTIKDFPAQFAYLLGGTSLIIIVGVALDTMSQIESHLKMHHQDGIVKKGRIRSRNF